MKKATNLILVFIFINLIGYAQFNPDETGKSLVKVMVKGGGEANVCSGFIWQKDEWIVTSLHAMKKNGTIQVQYLNKYWRDAEIIKTLPKSDLVLLKTNIAAKPLSSPVKPITSYASGVAFPEKIYAQGYHGGADGHRTQSLEKGHANPETIEYLVVKEESKQLVARLGIPQLNLPILYLNGSLLPGYSGAPIYNAKGELVGIGDGGLEGGQVNVSWAIPARFIDELMNSATAELPANMDQLDLLFSAKVSVKIETENIEEIQEVFAENYVSYASGDFEFYQTKTRSFHDMFESSIDPENLDYFVQDFTEGNLFINYDMLGFDIYEDAINGVIIAVPEGVKLYYDESTATFSADLKNNFLYGNYFTLEYSGFAGGRVFTDVDMAVDMLLEQIDLNYGPLVNGFYEDEEYSYSLQIDEKREVAYILYSGNSFFTDALGDQNDLKMYLTVLLDDNKVFYTLSTISLPVYKLADAVTYGIDCINNYQNSPEYCDFFELFMHVIASSHMTTFANTNVVATRK
ncbi:MAG: serine protease [Bacteroidales bacterium]